MSDKALIVSNPLAPTTFAEAQKFAEMICKTEFVPAAFKGNAGAVLAAIQYGAEVGLAPLAALQNIAVINGKPSLYGDAVPAVCMAHPSFVSMQEEFDDKTMTATCIANRSGNAPFTGKFSKADAEAAGLWGKQGPWKSYPRRMLQMRARGFALRDAFPDALKGLITREEAEDYQVKIVNAEPIAAEESPLPPTPVPTPDAGVRSQEQGAAATPERDKPVPPMNPDESDQGGMTDEGYHDVIGKLWAAKDGADLSAIAKEQKEFLDVMSKSQATSYKIFGKQMREYFAEVD